MAGKSKKAVGRELVSIDEGAKRLGVSKPTFRKYALLWNLNRVVLPGGRNVRYYLDEIDDHIGKLTVKEKSY